MTLFAYGTVSLNYEKSINSAVTWFQPGNGNRGGVGGVFLVYPPLAENFSKIPPLEILGQAAILFFK